MVQKQSQREEWKEKLKERLEKKPSPAILPKHSAKQENILDLLTEKSDYEENIKKQFKNKQQQRRRQ